MYHKMFVNIRCRMYSIYTFPIGGGSLVANGKPRGSRNLRFFLPSFPFSFSFLGREVLSSTRVSAAGMTSTPHCAEAAHQCVDFLVRQIHHSGVPRISLILGSGSLRLPETLGRMSPARAIRPVRSWSFVDASVEFSLVTQRCSGRQRD